jgi:hypothetical protein
MNYPFITLSTPALIFLSLISLSIPAQAAEPCSLDFAQLKSPLDASSKDFKNVQPEKRDPEKRVVSQAANLKSGERVEFSGGGCAHLAYTFTFSNVKGVNKDPARNLRLALNLLEKTPAEPAKKDALVKALKEALKKEMNANGGSSVALPCGDASCDLEAQGKTLAITYSLAL